MENAEAFHDYMESVKELMIADTDKLILDGVMNEFSDDKFFKETVTDIKKKHLVILLLFGSIII